jgi:hypothetical protein
MTALNAMSNKGKDNKKGTRFFLKFYIYLISFNYSVNVVNRGQDDLFLDRAETRYARQS